MGIVEMGDFRFYATELNPWATASLYKSWMAKEAGVLRYYPDRFDA